MAQISSSAVALEALRASHGPAVTVNYSSGYNSVSVSCILIALLEHMPVLRICTALIKMSALSLRIEDPDDLLANQTHRILQDFLQPSSRLTIKDTAHSILAFLPKNASGSTEVWDFGETCIEIVEQIPYYHPSQIKLAALFEELGKSSKFGSLQSSEVLTSRLRCWKSSLTRKPLGSEFRSIQ